MVHAGTREIATKRLLLRRLRPEDADAAFKNWTSDPQVTHYLTWTPHADASLTRQLFACWAQEYERENCYRWVITWLGRDEPIGMIDVVALNENTECCEIGYCLSRKHWGQGVMTEALSAVIRYLFEHTSAVRISACHAASNQASGRVMEKSGMRYEGLARQAGKTGAGERCDLKNYAILREDRKEMK